MSFALQPRTNSFHHYAVNPLWAGLRALRRFRNRIDGFQARIVWNIVVLICSILRVELTLVVNEVQGVNELDTTGQLIPFLLGLGALLAMIAEAMTRERRKVYGFPLLVGKFSPDLYNLNV